MRKGQKVTVKALTAMPGVADGAVLHDVEWGLRLATLVNAGRYEVLEGGYAEPPAAAVAAEGGEGHGGASMRASTAGADGDSPRRTRRR